MFFLSQTLLRMLDVVVLVVLEEDSFLVFKFWVLFKF